MNSTPPFVAQERPDSCAVACLRMILAFQGRRIEEAEVIQATDLQEGGLTPEELCRLARLYGLRSQEQQLDEAELAELVKLSRFPIVFLFRGPLDGVDMTHAVIPLRMSPKYVTVLDPLRGQRRLTIRKFEQARRLVGHWVVLWEIN
jgi:ABC-type bacteriocin/lantibiotic exporter with double-glycine peptidase domain